MGSGTRPVQTKLYTVVFRQFSNHLTVDKISHSLLVYTWYAWMLYSNGPWRTSQEFSGSGCGTATSWYYISILFRRVAPGSPCVSGKHFLKLVTILALLFHLAPSSILPRLCLRKNSFRLQSRGLQF